MSIWWGESSLSPFPPSSAATSWATLLKSKILCRQHMFPFESSTNGSAVLSNTIGPIINGIQRSFSPETIQTDFQKLSLTKISSTVCVHMCLCQWPASTIFSCPEQLNRTPCLSGTTNNQSLHNTTEWPQRLVTFETFDQSNEKTWPDQKRSTYLPS